MRYFISVIGVVVSFLLLCFVTEEGVSVVWMLHMADPFTIGIVVLVVITILLSAGLHKDFIQAFRLALSKKGDISLLRLKRSKEAVDLALKAIIGSGLLSTSVGVVEVLEAKTVIPSNLGVNLGVVSLGLVYSAFLCLLLIPIQAKLKIKIMEYMEE